MCPVFHGPLGGVHAPRAHCVGYLSNFCRKWSTSEALVNTAPWWRLLGEQLWQCGRAPLGDLTCNQRSSRLKEDNLHACQQWKITKDAAQAQKKKTHMHIVNAFGPPTGRSCLSIG